MVQQRVERKLVSVVVADVVGYSRLMELDEEGTHARLNVLQRDLLKPKISEHRGRIIKNTGDGALVEFASVVDAVRCAVEIQREMIDRSADFPEDRRIVFRIGVNLGDVIVEPGDIHGDGVNVAARLEGLAEPGGVCISGTAYDQVRDRVPYVFTEKGEQTVKNISRPVRVYSLSANAIAALLASPPSVVQRQPSGRYWRRGWPAAVGIATVIVVVAGLWFGFKTAKETSMSGSLPRLSIVVLPFTNLSADPGQDYLADVITEELTTGLSRIKGAFVIARSTAFTYKGKPVEVKQVSKDLGVRYVLEGSAQHGGSKVRVTAQLIDAATGAHLWADQFDADQSDLLGMQDEIVTRLSRALAIQLVAADVVRVSRTRPDNLNAQDLVMALLEVIPSAQSADPTKAILRADERASRAIAIDPNFDVAHLAKSWVLMAQNRHEEAIVEAEHTLLLNPSNITAYLPLGFANVFLCRPERSIEAADKAIRLSPRDPLLWVFYEIKGEAFFILQQEVNTIEWVRRSLAIAPRGDPNALLLLISSLALSNHEADASDALKRYLSSSSAKSKTISQFQKQRRSLADNPKWLAYNVRFAEGLRLAGMPE